MVPHKKKAARKQAAAQSKRKTVGRQGGGKQLRASKRSSAEITPARTERRDPDTAEEPAEHLAGIRLSGSESTLERLLAKLR
ncbi:MAG: hypothetical protein H0X25_15050 [Acidobacteriales bacterium]|nr:hypothetical protein [Terriglobales bacterium]